MLFKPWIKLKRLNLDSIALNAHSGSTSFANALANSSTARPHIFYFLFGNWLVEGFPWGRKLERNSELWCESGPLSFGVLPECTAEPERFLNLPFAFSFDWWIWSPLSVWSLLPHSHTLTDKPFTDTHQKIVNTLEIQSLTVGSLVCPLFPSPSSFRQGPGGHVIFWLASKWSSSRRVASPIAKLVCHLSVQVFTRLTRLSPVFPGWHPVYSRVPNGQCLGEMTLEIG